MELKELMKSLKSQIDDLQLSRHIEEYVLINTFELIFEVLEKIEKSIDK